MAATQLDLAGQRALQGLRLADFSAVAHVQSVWDDSVELAEDLHQEKRNKILRGFNEAPELQFEVVDRFQKNPLIEVYTGVAGAGKTQLLSPVRKSVLSAGKHFVLVDMTGVNSFYPTVCLHLVQSLLQKTPQGYLQIEHILANLVRIIVKDRSEEEILRELRLAAASPKQIEEIVAWITNGLNRTVANFARPIRMHFRSDVLRALIMLGLLKDDDRAESAYDWLQGGELEEEQARSIRLPRKLPAKDIVQAVTAIMSLRAPTMLAFDQLDVIVNQFETASRGGNSETAAAAKAAVIDIVGGLAALWEHGFRCQILVSCLQQTWEALKGNLQASLMDRFHAPSIRLAEISHDEIAKKIVALRLQRGYQEAGFHPEYPTWPFADSFFEVGMTPRSLLQKCLAHREKCLEAGQVTETGGPDAPLPPPAPKNGLDRAFLDIQGSVSIQDIVAGTEDSENALGALLDFLCNLLIVENPPPPQIQANVDLDPGPSSKSRTGLHTRIHLTFLTENDREEFFCFRAIQHSNANAFQARLRAAITDSGVNFELPFRRLVIVRNRPVPGGEKTSELVRLLGDRGGRILSLSEAELRTMVALKSLRDQNDSLFEAWLKTRRPLRQLAFVREALQDYFTLIQAPPFVEPPTRVPEPNPEPPGQTTQSEQPPSLASTILVGILLSPLDNRTVELPLGALTRHVLIRAGSGGGKTVLLKRLVESAALLGVPSIVLDPGNDLAFLGDAWPSAPLAWLSDDAKRANAYQKQVEVVVWTPGRIGGRPLAFSPLPDFSAVLDDEDDFESAVLMAAGSLSEATGASKGAGSQLKFGILTEAIRHFARRGGQTLPALADFLSDLPPEVRDEVKISTAPKLARSMADALQATLLGSKALIPEGRGTSLCELLGIGANKTRVSVVSLAGLSETNGDRLAFVNQLAVELFTWIRKNPSKGPGHVKGLLVVDEARDFIPSVKSTPCKDSLMRVAAQARKYGFGLLMATQNPTDIDHKAAGQCATQFFGRAASPNVVDAMRQAIEERGGSAPDLTRLGKGQFYFSSSESEKYKHPVRVQVPICLTYHPDGVTLTESEILIRARRPSDAIVR